MSDYQAVQAALKKYAQESGDPNAANLEVDILTARYNSRLGAALERLMELPGIGPVTAMRILAAIGRLEGWDDGSASTEL